MDLVFGRTIRYHNFFLFKKMLLEDLQYLPKSVLAILGWFSLEKEHIVIDKYVSELVKILYVCRFTAVSKKAIPVF